MSQPIPPIVPDPGSGQRVYPFPLPPAGHHTPDTFGQEPYDGAASEEEVIRQQEEERRREQDLVDLFTEQHRTIRGLLGELTDEATTAQRRGELAEVAVAELSRYLALERRYLLAAMKEALPQADSDGLLAGLSEIEEATQRLASRGPDDAEFMARGGELAELVGGHADQQQEHLFPQLREAGDRERLRELAQRARAAKDSAPTRPHPGAPERPPLSRITEPVIGAADKVRDEITRRPTDPADID